MIGRLREQEIRYSRVRAVTAIVVMVCAVTVMLTLHRHVMYYQEQHVLFRFTHEYFDWAMAHGGPAYWLGAFVIQFYYYPWLGAIIIGALLTGVYLLTESIVAKVTGRNDLLQIGVAAAVAVYLTLDGADENPGIAVEVLAGLAVVRLLLMPLKRRGGASVLKLWQAEVAFAMAAAWLAAGYVTECRGYDRKQHDKICAYRAIMAQDWDAAIAVTEDYLEEVGNDHIVNYMRCLARAHKGELTDHLFDYPMWDGTDDLIFSWKRDKEELEYGHLVHEHLGNLNAAHHLAFEAMTALGETAPRLLTLARINIAIGRPTVAQKFVNVLRSTLFYRSEADRLQRQIDGEEAVDMHYVWAGRVDNDFINVLYPAQDLRAIVEAEPDNDMARQYLYALLMLANDQEALVGMLRPGEDAGERIEEVKFTYSMSADATPLSELGMSCDDSVRYRYMDYFTTKSRGDGRKLREEFGNTFWYYIYNECPYGPEKRSTMPSRADISYVKH